jgi:hypothetical protein
VKPNLIQAEFFHVGGEKIRSLDALQAECLERTKEVAEPAVCGTDVISGIITIVRFFDYDGSLTKLVLQERQLNEEREQVAETLAGKLSWWRRILLIHRYDHLRAKMISAEGRVCIVYQYLQHAILKGKPVAVELMDCSLRFVRAEEFHELLETTKNAKHVWLFIFSPNTSLSTRNELVTTMTWA